MSDTHVYFTSSSVKLRVQSMQVSAPIDFDERFVLRNLLNDLSDELPKDEFNRITEMIYGGTAYEKMLQEQAQELTDAYEEMIKTLVYQFADNHARALRDVMAKLQSKKNASA